MFKTDIGEGHLISCESVNHDNVVTFLTTIGDFCPLVNDITEFVYTPNIKVLLKSDFLQRPFYKCLDRQFSSISFRGPPTV